MPSGSAAISPTRTAPAPSGSARSAVQGGVLLVGGDHRHELPLVRHVERVDAEQVARTGHGRVDGQRGLVEHDGQVGVAGELVRNGSEPTAGRVAHPARRRGDREEPVDEPADRGGVGADVGLEGQVAAGQHHRHAVVADRARAQHDVARLHLLGAEPAAGGSTPTPVVVM